MSENTQTIALTNDGEPANALSDNFARESLGSRYTVQGELGRGGMGVVYRVFDRHLNRDLAVKVLREEYREMPKMAARFMDEATIAAQLQHPGICPVHDMGTTPDGRPYITMKLVKGRNLAALLGERPDVRTQLPQFVKIFGQLCDTLASAHAKRVIHRDLKPANVMVGAFSELQVMDWGLAKVIGESPAVANPPRTEAEELPNTVSVVRTDRTPDSATQAGTVMGTYAYMPPEQARGEVENLDCRCDVFGLGAVLCEILTGQPPYIGKVIEVTAAAQLGAVEACHARLDQCGADPEVIALAKSCLAKEPDQRPADAGEVAGAITRYLESVQERLRQTEMAFAETQVKATEQRKRRRVVRLAIGILVAVLLVGIAGTTMGLVHADAQRRTAEKARNHTREALDTMIGFFRDDSLVITKEMTPIQRSNLNKLLASYKEFAAENVHDQQTRESMAQTAEGVGQFAFRAGLQEDAVAAIRVATDEYMALAAEFPNEPKYRWSLALNLSSLGSILADLGQRADAEKHYRQALEIHEVLVVQFPAERFYRSSSARCHFRLGNLLDDDRKCTLAQEQFRKALTIQEELIADRPSEPFMKPIVNMERRELADSYDGLGRSLIRSGQAGAAEEYYRKALAIREAVVAEYPNERSYLTHLGASRCNLGLCIYNADKPAESLQWFDNAIALLASIAESDERRAGASWFSEARKFLRDSHLGRAAANERLEKRAEALKDWDRVIDLSPKAERQKFRTQRALARVRAGQVAEGINEVVKLQGEPGVDGDQWYNFACIYSVASTKATEKNEYAETAMAHLQTAVKAGFKDAAHMAKDSDLDPLRGRDDFKKLLESLSDANPEPAPNPR